MQSNWMCLESRSGGCGNAMNMVGELKECYFNIVLNVCLLIQKIALFMRTAFSEANFGKGDWVSFCCCTEYSC